ncbi:large subunit ribosomal protein L24e [Blastomyces parvus]|uniref:Ribosome biogenesis protein RLP24 n=1 Tax=Blastomyces parvus TaxID=2060905 RepID=A0A2B7XH15_9EURO|nr:large subunit ribosomal protein L24e [Blastomyces parvus]
MSHDRRPSEKKSKVQKVKIVGNQDKGVDDSFQSRLAVQGSTSALAAMRVETCHFCSQPCYPSKGITFVRNDARTFRFCRSKCHKNFKMKRQPRKLKWTKTHRALHGKEMIVDSSLLLSQFSKRRNVPVKYDRNLVSATIKAMERVEEIRLKRERIFTKRRLAGKLAREKQRAEDRRVVAEGEHLIRKELKEREEENVPLDANKNLSHVVGTERQRTKKKTRLLVDGGIQDEMEID